MPSTKPAALSKADLDFMNGKQLTTEGFQPINKTSDSEPDTTGVEANDHGGDGDQSQADPTAALVGATGLTNTDTADKQSESKPELAMPKKRGATKEHSDVAPTKKTRGIAQIKKPVKKPVKKGSKKNDKAVDEEATATSPETPEPKAGKKDKAIPSLDGNVTEPNSPESATTKDGSPRKRAASAKSKAASLTISSSIEKAAPQDKLILDMKADGKTWKEIRVAYEALTGTEIRPSTLPNRYARLQTNFAVFHEEDLERLKSAEAEVEKEHQATKWSKVLSAMEAKGTTEKYTNLMLRQKSAELTAAAKTTTTTGKDAAVEDAEADTEMEDAEASS